MLFVLFSFVAFFAFALFGFVVSCLFGSFFARLGCSFQFGGTVVSDDVNVLRRRSPGGSASETRAHGHSAAASLIVSDAALSPPVDLNGRL